MGGSHIESLFEQLGGTYTRQGDLLTAGMLDGHLADIGEQPQKLFLRLVEQYADTEGVTEALKADDLMAWVRKMNSIRNRANEAVM